jgi:hypothetical protein
MGYKKKVAWQPPSRQGARQEIINLTPERRSFGLLCKMGKIRSIIGVGVGVGIGIGAQG